MKYQSDIEFTPNSLVYGDCLEVMRQWADAGMCADLIYLDPPFNSNVNYHIIYDKERPRDSKINTPTHKAFDDMWDWHAGESDARIRRLTGLANTTGRRIAQTMQGLQMMLGECGMLAYVTYMAERLLYMSRVLKPTGSIYLHCDPTASYYLRIVLNAVFGAENYRNEIVWSYGKMHNAKKNYPQNHDTILFYTKSDEYIFHPIKKADIEYKNRWAKYVRDNKIYYGDVKNKSDKMLLARIKKVAGEIGRMDNSTVLYDFNKEFKAQDNNWYIPTLKGNAKEYLGYPTQKPLKLLKRIVSASSNPGDIVLDPFCGCGTAAEASFQLKRKFIGVDISPYAINQVCKRRLKEVQGLTVHGIPGDLDSLEKLGHKNPRDFEKLAVTAVPGFAPNDKQTGDGGVDGWAKLLNANPVAANGEKLPRDCIAQVKLGDPTASAIRDFSGRSLGGVAAIGVFITLRKQQRTPTMRDEINRVGKMKFAGGAKEYDRLVFWSMEEFYNDEFPNLPEFTDPYTGKAMHASLRGD